MFWVGSKVGKGHITTTCKRVAVDKMQRREEENKLGKQDRIVVHV